MSDPLVSVEMTTPLPWFAANLCKSVRVSARNSIFAWCICEHKGFVTYSSEDNSLGGQEEKKKNQHKTKKQLHVIDDVEQKHKASRNKDLEWVWWFICLAAIANDKEINSNMRSVNHCESVWRK